MRKLSQLRVLLVVGVLCAVAVAEDRLLGWDALCAAYRADAVGGPSFVYVGTAEQRGARALLAAVAGRGLRVGLLDPSATASHLLTGRPVPGETVRESLGVALGTIFVLDAAGTPVAAQRYPHIVHGGQRRMIDLIVAYVHSGAASRVTLPDYCRATGQESLWLQMRERTQRLAFVPWDRQAALPFVVDGTGRPVDLRTLAGGIVVLGSPAGAAFQAQLAGLRAAFPRVPVIAVVPGEAAATTLPATRILHGSPTLFAQAAMPRVLLFAPDGAALEAVGYQPPSVMGDVLGIVPEGVVAGPVTVPHGDCDRDPGDRQP